MYLSLSIYIYMCIYIYICTHTFSYLLNLYYITCSDMIILMGCCQYVTWVGGCALSKGIVARLLRHPQNLSFSKQANGKTTHHP